MLAVQEDGVGSGHGETRLCLANIQVSVWRLLQRSCPRRVRRTYHGTYKALDGKQPRWK